MSFYEVFNSTSGHSFGAYEAETPDEAIHTVMRLGGADEMDADDDVQAREVYGFKCGSSKDNTIEEIQQRMGTEATRDEAEAVFEEGEWQIESEPSSIWWVRDWEKAVKAALNA